MIQAAIYQAIQDNAAAADAAAAAGGGGGTGGRAGASVDFLFGSAVTRMSFPDLRSNARGLVDVTLSAPHASSGRGGGGNQHQQQQEQQVTARLVVGADGPTSAVRKLAGMTTWGWNYGQEAVVATVKVDTDASTAWQRYLRTGPLALLPLWDKHCSVVWSAPVEESTRLKDMSNVDFVRELNDALKKPSLNEQWSNSFDSSSGIDAKGNDFPLPLRAAKKEFAALADAVMNAVLLNAPTPKPPTVLEVVSKRVSFPLLFQQARSYVAPRVALIGDAAHSIHPQAGQGLNLGMADAALLAKVVSHALATGGDIGEMRVLEAYGSERYKSNLAMMGAVDGINKIFSPEENEMSGKVKQVMRSFGLLGLQGLGPVKRQLAKIAMGMH